MYDTEETTRPAADAVDRVTSLGREFALWSRDERDRLLERLVRIQQASNREMDPISRMISGEGAECKAAEPVRPRGITLENIDRVLTYQPWTPSQTRQSEPVREAILALGRAILRNVPDCPDRSVAIRKLRELRMDVNAAITHRGEF